jgi:hypothetical protein
MSAAFDPSHPESMTADERLAEIANILADGALRLRQRAALATVSPLSLPAESSQIRLDVCPETRTHGAS